MTARIRSNALRARGFIVVAAGAAITAHVLLACATEGAPPSKQAPTDGEIVVVADSGVDGGDADSDGSSAACDDCEYFPETCAPDVLCANGPFDNGTVGGALDLRTRINVIRGRSLDDVWAAGSVGALARFDGTSWARSESGTQETLGALWLADSEEIAFGRPEFLFTRGIEIPDGGVSAGGWTAQTAALVVPAYKSVAKTFESAWAAPGAEWAWVAMRPLSTLRPTNGLWRLRRSPSGGFEIAMGLNPFQYAMTSVHGHSPDVLWAVGDDGRAVLITDAQAAAPVFEVFNTQTWNGLRGVWTASESEAWAVGASGTIRHYTGDRRYWEIVSDVPTTEHLNAVWGSSPSDVWAVGERGVVLHYDGARWSRVKIAALGPRRPDLYTVWIPAPGHVWIGGHGVLLSLGGKP